MSWSEIPGIILTVLMRYLLLVKNRSRMVEVASVTSRLLYPLYQVGILHC